MDLERRKPSLKEIEEARVAEAAVNLVLDKAGAAIKSVINNFVAEHRDLLGQILQFGGSAPGVGNFKEHMEYEYATGELYRVLESVKESKQPIWRQPASNILWAQHGDTLIRAIMVYSGTNK